jgi:NADP-dependent 3-hydroxy acid dehydrogenase YdfG
MTKDIAKIALVTGASRGLGKNTALSLAKKGVGAIAALLSEDNRWVNGQRIEVSGGQSL